MYLCALVASHHYPCCPTLTKLLMALRHLDNLETKVSDLEQNMGKLITLEEVDNMKQDLKDEAASDFENNLEEKLKEGNEIEKRELNLIFWGVPESISDDNSVRHKHDSDFVLRVGEAMGVPDIKIAQIIRIGQRPKNVTETDKNKSQGLLVKFVDKSQRHDVLRGSKNLQSCGDEFEEVSITKYLTLSQR